jgi:hypothetical protein
MGYYDQRAAQHSRSVRLTTRENVISQTRQEEQIAKAEENQRTARFDEANRPTRNRRRKQRDDRKHVNRLCVSSFRRK